MTVKTVGAMASDGNMFDDANPVDVGAVTPGTAIIASRKDHVHAIPAATTVAAGSMSAADKLKADMNALPQSGAYNYKIAVSVAGNDLTVALKGVDGNDPSATNPVYARIGNTVRTITAALSSAAIHGTNLFDAGCASLATYDIDYFVFLGWNTADAVPFLGFSRIPMGVTYGDFSATSTSDHHLLCSRTLNVVSTDPVENIGRFNAILSASAAYNWSLTTQIIISRPIYHTRYLTYVPVLTGFSSIPTNCVYRYIIQEHLVTLHWRQLTAGTSNATTFTMVAPISAQNVDANMYWIESIQVDDAGVQQAYPGIAGLQGITDSKTINLYKLWNAAAFTNTGGKRSGAGKLTYSV